MKLCWFALVDPSTFSQLQQEDNKALELQPIVNSSISILRRALRGALVIVLASSLTGFASGWLLSQFFGRADGWTFALQVLGAGILLWATLAVRGWEVQSYSNATLTERVNQWIFRFLCWFGTFLIVMAIGWEAAA